MRPKHRRAKLKKHEKQAHPHGYYEKLLWFIISDSVQSEDKNEITGRYLRAWDDIWHTKTSSGKPGRPATDTVRYLRQMNALLNIEPGLKPNTAAKRVAANASLPSDNARDNFVRTLVRRYNSACKDIAALPKKNEKLNFNALPAWLNEDVVEADGIEFWKRQGPKFLASFLGYIERELKA